MTDRFSTLRQGLVGAWCPSLAYTGRILPDLSRASRNAAASGTISWRSSRYGVMVAGDGSTGSFDAGSNCGMAGASSGTIACWVTRTSASENIAVGCSDTISGRRFNFVTLPTAIYLQAENGALSFPSNSFTAVGTFHLCMVYQSSSVTMYFNGVSLGATTAGGAAPPATLSANLGTFKILRDSNASVWASSFIDDIRLYNRALTLSEVKLLASRPRIGLLTQRHRRTLVPTSTKQISVRVGGSWLPATPYVNVGGTWQLATPYTRQGGVWN